MTTIPDLPDRTICRTELYTPGTNGLYVCRVQHPYACRYALSFGYDFFFCYHDDRASLVATPAEPVQPAEAFTSPLAPGLNQPAP